MFYHLQGVKLILRSNENIYEYVLVPEIEIKDAKISGETEDPTKKLPVVELLKLENSKIEGQWLVYDLPGSRHSD